jgi:uncharacterized protein YdaU (DUF1376 family)
MSLPYYRWFPGDYIRDTRRLTMMQHGAYRLLIDEYMVSGKALSNDLPALYRICCAVSGEEQVAVRYALEEFFVLAGPVWKHKRCEDEIAHQSERSELARKSVQAREMRKHRLLETTPTPTQQITSNDDRTMIERSIARSSNQNQNQITEEEDKKESPQGKSGGRPPLDVPEWIPKGAWQDWHAYRLARKGWTRRAQELSLQTLEQLRDSGHDPQRVIDQSIERGWSGLFPIAGTHARLPPPAQSKAAAWVASLREPDSHAFDLETINAPASPRRLGA